jgi:hypothetical protein
MKWIKPSGLKITTNDLEETIEYCKSLGWKEDKPEIKKEKKAAVKTANKNVNRN